MTDKLEENGSLADARSVSSTPSGPASRKLVRDALEIGLAYAEEAAEADGGIEHCEIGTRTDVETIQAALASQPAPASREHLLDACDVACTYLEDSGKKAHAMAAIELRDAVRVALANTPDGWRESYAPLVIEARRLACAVRAEAVPALRDTGVNMSLADDLERFAALVSAALPQPPEMK